MFVLFTQSPTNLLRNTSGLGAFLQCDISVFAEFVLSYCVFRIPQCPLRYKFINVLDSNGFVMMFTIIICIDLAGRLGYKPSTDRLYALDKQ